MKLNIARVGALGPIGLVIVATALSAGCAAGGGEPSQGNESTSKTSEGWGIAPLGIGCGGGGAVGTFAFSAPQVINTIAADTSALQNATFQLYAVNQQGQQTLVNQQAQQASAAQQAMMATTSNYQSAANVLASQTSQNAFTNTQAAQQFANQQSVTTASGFNSAVQNSSTAVTHQDSHNDQAWGSNVNSAVASNAATNNAWGNSANQNAAAQNTNAWGANTAQNAANTAAGTNAFNTSIVPTVGFFGGVGVLALPISNSTAANQFANQNALANAFFNNGTNSAAQNVNNAFFNTGANTASQSAAANQSAFNTGDHTDNASADTANQASAAQSAYSNTVANVQNAASGTAAQATGSNLSSATSQNHQDATQIANASSLQSSASQQFSNAMVFNNLSYLNANQYVLQVNATTTQASNMLQLFQGSNNSFSNYANFPIAGCY